MILASFLRFFFVANMTDVIMYIPSSVKVWIFSFFFLPRLDFVIKIYSFDKMPKYMVWIMFLRDLLWFFIC